MNRTIVTAALAAALVLVPAAAFADEPTPVDPELQLVVDPIAYEGDLGPIPVSTEPLAVTNPVGVPALPSIYAPVPVKPSATSTATAPVASAPVVVVAVAVGKLGIYAPPKVGL